MVALGKQKRGVFHVRRSSHRDRSCPSDFRPPTDAALRGDRPHGAQFRTSEWRVQGVMRFIGEGETRATHLATRLGVSAPVLSRHIADLEELGLVVRRPDPADGQCATSGVVGEPARPSCAKSNNSARVTLRATCGLERDRRRRDRPDPEQTH